MDESPWLGGSQTRVCDTGSKVTPFSLFRCGSQRYNAIHANWRESDSRGLWLRPHQPPQSLRSVGQRPGNPTTAVAGCRRGAFSHLSGHRRLRNFRNQQPVGLALSGLPVGSGRHRPSTWMPTPIRLSRFWAIPWPASPPGCPTRNWCPSAAVPRRVWRRRRRTARNWALLAGCRRSRRLRPSRWWPAG